MRVLVQKILFCFYCKCILSLNIILHVYPTLVPLPLPLFSPYKKHSSPPLYSLYVVVKERRGERKKERERGMSSLMKMEKSCSGAAPCKNNINIKSSVFPRYSQLSTKSAPETGKLLTSNFFTKTHPNPYIYIYI